MVPPEAAFEAALDDDVPLMPNEPGQVGALAAGEEAATAGPVRLGIAPAQLDAGGGCMCNICTAHAPAEQAIKLAQACWRARPARLAAIWCGCGGVARLRGTICPAVAARVQPHQRDGIRWLAGRLLEGGGAILADEPGAR